MLTLSDDKVVFCSNSVRDTPEHVFGRKMTFEQQRQPRLVFI